MRFYGHFAAAYGTFWLAILGLALLSQSSIETGVFGLFGFPILAAIYAIVRVQGTRDPKHELAALREQLARQSVPPAMQVLPSRER